MHSVTHFLNRRTITALVSSLLVSLPASADDLDVFTSRVEGSFKPNILLVLDYSGSMAEDANNNNTSVDADRKLSIMKRAVDSLMEREEGNINLGLGSLYDTRASGVRWPIAELTADPNTVDSDIPPGSRTMRQVINSQLEKRGAGGSTNTVGAMVDAALYFQGAPVMHDDTDVNNAALHKPDTWNAGLQRYTDGNDYSALATSYTPANAFQEGVGFASDTWTQPDYISPIAHECQENYMILISDGIPKERTIGPALDAVLGAPSSTCADISSTVFGNSGETFGNCGAEIAHKMATEDQLPGVPNSTVKTYTIGFSIAGSGAAFLDGIAKAGQGDFFQANDEAQLSNALSLVLDDILKGSQNFAELSIDLEKASFSHDNRTYFSLFDPSSRRAWQGNVKGYFLTEAGLVDVNNAPAIITDAEGARFDDAAQSFWSDSADGNEVIQGGASEQIEMGNRKLYTNATGNNNVDLSNGANALTANNNLITDAMLGNPNDRAALLAWLQTAPMGDPLHSKVVTADYGDKKVAYVVTNQGFLHAIDASKPTDPTNTVTSGGEELFAFMPTELLANLPDLQENAASLDDHIYGLDGQITPIHTDLNDDGVVDDGEKLVLVFGMRRGGNSYYAVDVTNTNSPKLEWQITGGTGAFTNLAQSWSRMSLVTVRTGPDPENNPNHKKKVLVFAGGYDAAVVDDTDGRLDVNGNTLNANGNAIYMINLDGTPIWSTSGDAGASDYTAGMDYSIPSDLAVIDTDGDKLADRIYAGDTGSQVWRVDFDNVNSSGDFDVTHFADLYENNVNQPFFYPPSVAMNRSAQGDFLSVSIASGNRTDPLDADSANRIYMLRDEDTEKGAPNSHTTIQENNLFPATDNSIASANPVVATAAKNQLAQKSGWYIALNQGEKGLSTLLSFEGNLMATTYEPSTAVGDGTCDFIATGKLYIMDLRDGRPVKYVDGLPVTEGLLASDRITPLNGSAIPSSPVIVFPKGSSQVNIFVDKESISTVSQRLNTVFWHGQ